MEADISHQVLTYIGNQDGRIGFYQLTRRFGALDLNLPELVKQLIAADLVATRPGNSTEAQELYVLTERGHEVLRKHMARGSGL